MCESHDSELPKEKQKHLVVGGSIAIPHDELEFSFSRSAGPGGQNVNKLNTKAELRWHIGESAALEESIKERFVRQNRSRINNDGQLVLTSQRYRTQKRNIDDCLEKLRQLVLKAATPPKPRKKTRPSRASQQRRLKQKRQHSEKKQRRRQSLDD